MAIRYELYVRYEVIESLRSVGAARSSIRALFESLANNPFQIGNATEIDETGRPAHVKKIGKYSVYFWVDHAGKEVRIVDLVETGYS